MRLCAAACVICALFMQFSCSHTENSLYSTTHSTVVKELESTLEITGYGTSETAAKTVCTAMLSRLSNVTIEKKDNKLFLKNRSTGVRTPATTVIKLEENLYKASLQLPAPQKVMMSPVDTISFYMYFNEKPSLSTETEVSEHLALITTEIMHQLEKRFKKQLKRNGSIALDFFLIDFDPTQQRVSVTIRYISAEK